MISITTDGGVQGLHLRFTGEHRSSMDDKATTTPDVARFNRWAATYDESVLQRWYFGPVHARMLDLLMQEAPEKPPRCIVDVGCGTGRLLRAVSVRWPEAQLIGVDPAGQMVSQADRLCPKATFKVAPAESLPLPGESADIVLSSISFHHWAEQGRGLQEIARVLRPEGLFCLADHTFRLAGLFGGKVRSRDEIRGLLMSAGLAVRRYRRLRVRCVLIAVAQKGPAGAS
jgi:ubiquinone/menaquinone biosynthesis C-methylase UbiE